MVKHISFLLWTVVAILIVSAFAVLFMVDFNQNKHDESNLNYGRIVNETGNYMIGNRGGYVKIFYLANGDIIVEHKTLHPREEKNSSLAKIKIGDKFMIDKWKIYIISDSLIWVKCGDTIIKWFNEGRERGTIHYDLQNEKHRKYVPQYVIDKCNYSGDE